MKKIVIINNVVCQIDPLVATLSSLKHPENSITFSTYIDAEPTYVILDSKDQKILRVDDPSETGNAVCLPSGFLDLLSEGYGHTHQLLRAVSGLDIRFPKDELEVRLLSIDPIISMGTSQYSLALDSRMLHPYQHTGERISLNDFVPTPGGHPDKAYVAYFDDYQKKLVNIDALAGPPSRLIYRVDLPEDVIMDPVGLASLQGLPLSRYTCEVNYRTIRDCTRDYDPRSLRADGIDELVIGRHIFEADYNNQLFVRKDDPKLLISFDAFKKRGGERVARVSVVDSTIEKGDHPGIRVSIPERIFQGPFSSDAALVEQLNEGAHKKEYRLVDQAIIDRIYGGKQPTVALDEDVWFVNARMNQLEIKGDVFHSIDLSALNEEENGLFLIYDKQKKFPANIEANDIITDKDRYVALLIPHLHVLDPVGAARTYTGDLRAQAVFLTKTAVKGHHTAKKIPWRSTWLGEEMRSKKDNKNKESKANRRMGRRP